MLINGNTASTSEIFALGLKENHLATLVGEKTAGAMLSGRRFIVNEQVTLFLPVNDYLSATGYRIDQNGVKPDVQVKSAVALDYVLKQLIK